jgi:hypothetical protein
MVEITLSTKRLPKLVMLGCALPVTATARLALATAPTKFDEFMFEIAKPFPLNKPADDTPETVNELKVPSDVMFGWEFPDTVVATMDCATAPEIFDGFMFVIPCPSPKK